MLITENFNTELIRYLRNAEELWCAVALIKERGFQFIQDSVPKHCRQHFLVGIDLPTTPSVLRDMQQKQRANEFDCAIYQSTFNFHPKVYLIKEKGIYFAFIGSSNLTEGGLHHNVELNYLVNNQVDCNKIRLWFEGLFKDSFPLSDENLNAYEQKFEVIQDLQKKSRQHQTEIQLKKMTPSVNGLDHIDFTDRYFKKYHHSAFRSAIWKSDAKPAILERQVSKDRFIELHNIIWPKFKQYGLQVLQPNPADEHLISMIHQIDPAKPRALDAMWLSYGKTSSEIKQYQSLVGVEQKAKQTFIHHARIQIRIELDKIGIWLLFAKENDGGIFDRDFFKKEMQKPIYRNTFYSMLKKLPHDYFIYVGGEKRYCHIFTSVEQLHTFCLKDHSQDYFIIGRNYEITDKEMSEENLPAETLKVFKVLFPFYEMMKHRFPTLR